MKISKFDVTSVGRFANVELSLGRGMHILYGPNETGKSTLLSLYLDMLFGGAPTNRDWYETASRMRLELDHQGEVLDARRKRYRGQLVSVNDEWQPTDEWLVNLIGIDRTRYKQLYGFNHERLRSGGQSLLSSDGDAGISLFEAGSGVSHIQRLVNQYKERLAELFQPRMRKDAAALLNKSLREYQDARDRQRAHILRPSVWEAERSQVEAAKAKVDELGQTLQALRSRHAKLQRIARNRATYQTHVQVLEDLQTLQGTQYLSSHEEADIENTFREYHRLQEGASRERDSLGLEEEKLEDIQFNREVMALSAEFESLRDEFSLYQTARQERGQLEESLAALESAMERQLEAFCTDGPLEQKLSLEHRTRLEKLWADYQELQETKDALARTLEETKRQVVAKENRLSSMVELPDLTMVREKIQEYRRRGISSARLFEVREKYDRQMSEIGQIYTSNRLWQGDLDQLLALPIPMVETVQAYHVKLSKLVQRIEELERDLARVADDYDNHLAERVSLEQTASVPTEQELTASRTHRDEGWRLLKAKIASPKLMLLEAAAYVNGTQTLEEAYERAIYEADTVADRLRREADRVAKRAELTAQIEREERELSRLKESLCQTQEEEQSLLGKWRDEWLSSDINPLSPSEMSAWMQNWWYPLKQRMVESQQLKNEVAGLERDCDEVRRQIRAWVETYSLRNLTTVKSLDDQLALCENELHALDKVKYERDGLKSELAELHEGDKQLSLRMDGLQAKVNHLAQDYGALSDTYTYLPKDIQFLHTYLQGLDELWQLEARVAKERQQVTQKVEFIRRFEDKVASVVERLPEAYRDSLSDKLVLYTNLQRLYLDTKERYQHYQQQTSLIEAQKERLARITAEFEQASVKLSDWFARVGVENEKALLAFVEASKKYRTLLERRGQLEETMLAAGDGHTLSELIQEIREAQDMDALPGEIQSLHDSIRGLEEEQGAEQIRYGELKKAFAQYDGLQDTAILYRQESVAAAEEVAAHWEEIVQIQVNLKILEAAMNIYRDKNQSGVLEAASKFFARMTLGTYRGIELDDDLDGPRLFAVRSDGVHAAIKDLSDGTVDQLYFSLRLAFLDTQARSATVLPFVLDDVFVHFDDTRAMEALRILDEMADRIQILYFTHHEHFVDKVVAGAGLQHTVTHVLRDYIEYR